MADRPVRETWQANGRIVLRKYDHAGREQEILVNRGRKVQLTEEERLMNQELAYDDSGDPFVNGTLSPVRLPKETSESLQAIVDNPNTMTESDLDELLEAHHSTFTKKLTEITSPYIVKKLLAKAEVADGTSVKTMEKIEARLAELTAKDIKVIEHEKVVTGSGQSS